MHRKGGISSIGWDERVIPHSGHQKLKAIAMPSYTAERSRLGQRCPSRKVGQSEVIVRDLGVKVEPLAVRTGVRDEVADRAQDLPGAVELACRGVQGLEARNPLVERHRDVPCQPRALTIRLRGLENGE